MRFKLFLYAFIAMPIVALVLFVFCKWLPGKELKRYWPVQEFSFVDQNSSPIGLKDLKHKVWVANFLFTRCSEQCPFLLSQLQKLQKAFLLKESFRIVSFTVDPLHDSPQVLKDYEKKVGASSRWLFLTGERKALENLFFNSFKVAGTTMGNEFDGGMTHSTHFVLVDAQGYVRGYYDSMDSKAGEQLQNDIKTLLREIY